MDHCFVVVLLFFLADAINFSRDYNAHVAHVQVISDLRGELDKKHAELEKATQEAKDGGSVLVELQVERSPSLPPSLHCSLLTHHSIHPSQIQRPPTPCHLAPA